MGKEIETPNNKNQKRNTRWRRELKGMEEKG